MGLLILMITVAAFILRLNGIQRAEGTLREDEARLVLAADGVRETGVPAMPSGKLYFRGVVSAYLTAASRAILGPTDFAARLPNVLFGALLVPILFMFGRAVAGPAAGLALAIFGAIQPELIEWSGNAWMTSLFIVMFVAAAWPLYEGYELDRPRMQLAGAVIAVVAMLSHELGALLAGAVAMTIAVRWWSGDTRWYAGRTSLAALAILAAGIVLFVVLGLQLRAATLSGSAGEFRFYFGPSLSSDRFLVDLARWRDQYPLLLAAAAVGTVLWIASRFRRGVFLFSTFWVVAFVVWVVIAKKSERYGLVLLPLLGLVAAWTIAELANRRWSGPGTSQRSASPLLAGALIVAFGWSFYLDARLLQIARPVSSGPTWLERFRTLGASPNDLIMSDDPEIPAAYLGPVHYWERGDNFERYSYEDGGRIRHLYTGAVRVGTEADFRQLLTSLGDRTLWYIGRAEEASEFSAQILASAQVVHTAPEGETKILKIVAR